MIAARISVGALLLALVVVPSAQAQSMGGFIKNRAKERLKQKIAECIATDLACIRKAKEDGVEVKIKEAPPEAAPAAGSADASAAASLKPGEGAWRNYDFVPGDRVIFAEDFARDNVGDFPKRLLFKSGNIEIVEWEGARFLSTNTFGSKFAITLPEVLPERFTLEFDYSATGGNSAWIYFVDPSKVSDPSYIEMGSWRGGVDGGGIESVGSPAGDEYKYKDAVFPVRVMVDGTYVKVYMGETRVANVPNANLGRSNTIHFQLPGRPDRAAMVGNVRVAAGGRKLYDALTESGRVATQGIYFDSGSDRIRPESTPTLKEIGAMLNEHADLKLTIEGHTDNVGNADANLALAQTRADAVKAFLVSTYAVDEARLTSTGVGDAKPVAPNTTPEGRQQNRRVELVKQQ